MNLGDAFNQSLTALSRWRSGDADVDAVVDAMESLARAVAGRAPVIDDRYNAVLGDAGGGDDT